MYPIEVTKRTIGVNFTGDGKAEVLLWAPLCKKLEIKINQHIQLPLEEGKFGYWQLATDKIKPGDTYKFVLDGEKELPDPTSVSQPEGVHSPSQAVDITQFEWSDSEWKNPPLENYIFYELHTGTFSPQGTFEGIEKKLDHLVELGITAIEIMPIAQFPGSRNWGYDGAYPFAVQNSYDGAEGLKKLVDACHQKGLAVVLDVVYNHFGPEGNYNREFAPYFTSKYHTPWGDAVNFDDTGSDEVRRFFIENVLMWFRDFHIDALRLDAVHAIKDSSATHILREMREYTDKLMANTGRTYHLIVECDLNDPVYINPAGEDGYGMDAQWSDEFHHALRVAAGQERHGYYADFSGLPHLAKAYKDAYVYDGQYSEHRQKTFGSKATKNGGRQFVVFSQNHDQVGNRMLGERTSQLVSFEMLKLLAGAVLVSPYLPLLFMGEEWAEPRPFLYFVSHTDPELAAAVTKGRMDEFKEFHAEGRAPDPMAEKTFERSKLQWKLLGELANQTMFRYYQALISLRKEQPALRTLNRKHTDVQADDAAQVLLLHRWHEEQYLVCYMNFSNDRQPVNILAGKAWHKLFDSASPQWNGPHASPETLEGGAEVMLQPASLLIYANHV